MMTRKTPFRLSLHVLALASMISLVLPAMPAAANPIPQPFKFDMEFDLDIPGAEYGLVWSRLNGFTVHNAWFEDDFPRVTIPAADLPPAYDVVETGSDQNGLHFEISDGGRVVGSATLYPGLSSPQVLTIDCDGYHLVGNDPFGYDKEPITIGAVLTAIGIGAAAVTAVCAMTQFRHQATCNNDLATQQQLNPEKSCFIFDDEELGCAYDCWVVCFDPVPDLVQDG